MTMNYKLFILLVCYHQSFVIPTLLSYSPTTVFKGSPISLTCTPSNTLSRNISYIWFRGNYKLEHVTSSTLNVTASLDTRSNYTCIAGEEEPAEISIDVLAPPSFIRRLRPYQGFLYTSQNISLTCCIECYPLCDIVWTKDGQIIPDNSPFFYITKTIIPADHGTNDFESIESTLVWNTQNQPLSLDKNAPSSPYSCSSKSTQRDSHDVKSTCYVGVEFPPEDLKLSTNYVLVEENHIPELVKCNGSGRPDLSYQWINKKTLEVVGKHDILLLQGFTRFSDTIYTCIGYNIHGSQAADVTFSVQYKPTCRIEFAQIFGKPALLCVGDGHPEVDHSYWTLLTPEHIDEIGVYQQNVIQRGQNSYLIFDTSINVTRTYQCTAYSSTEFGSACERTIPGRLPEVTLTANTNIIVHGTAMELTCHVMSFQHTAEIEWYNGTTLMQGENGDIQTVYVINLNGTYTTESKVSFEATRWDSGRTFKCSATNSLMISYDVPPVAVDMFLVVLYPPFVEVSPLRIVVQEERSATLSCTYDANPGILTSVHWLKNGKKIKLIEGKHEGSNIRDPSLVIKHIDREDTGVYSCVVENNVGSTTSDGVITVHVLYPPTVEVLINYSTSIEPLKQINATLICIIKTGNPSSLYTVHWFLNGSSFTSIQDKVLKLELTDDTFGNYTCQGENEVGLGPVSEPKELVSYPTIAPKLTYQPKPGVKNTNITLNCSVGDASGILYDWYQNGSLIGSSNKSILTIPSVSIDTRVTFSCVARKGEISTKRANVFVDVVAPPSFIDRLPPYRKVLLDSGEIVLSCRIECYPLCSIIWFENAKQIDFSNDIIYQEKTRVVPPDSKKKYFMSVESALIWTVNLNKQDIFDQSSWEFTCASSKNKTNKYEKDINSTVFIELDYPPTNLTISNTTIDVTEGDSPEAVSCNGLGHPILTYQWIKKATGETIQTGDTLRIREISRTNGGYYTCEAYNRNGIARADVFINVLQKPECSINYETHENSSILVCTSKSNPNDVSFEWKVLSNTVEDNSTESDNEEESETDSLIFASEGVRSFLLLNETIEERTYICVVTNIVGEGNPCNITIPVEEKLKKKKKTFGYISGFLQGEHWLGV